MENYSYIYGLLCPYDNIIKYVGQSTQEPKTRLAQHRNDNRYNTQKSNWIKKIIKLGLKYELKLIILENCQVDLLNEKEKYWILYYKNNGYELKNCTDGGDCEYRIVSEETREKMSLSLKGKTLGRKFSDELKKIISERRKGYKSTEEAKNNISEGLRRYYLNKNGVIKKDIPKVGRGFKGKHTEESKIKIKNSLKKYYLINKAPFCGKVHTEESKIKLKNSLEKYYLTNKSAFYGKKHTEETKKLISESKKGKYTGENNHFYGKKHTEETKKMISDMQMDIILKPFYILDKDLNVIKLFTRRSDVFSFLRIKENNTQVYRVLDKGKLYKGYYFIRKEGFIETIKTLFGIEYTGLIE